MGSALPSFPARITYSWGWGPVPVSSPSLWVCEIQGPPGPASSWPGAREKILHCGQGRHPSEFPGLLGPSAKPWGPHPEVGKSCKKLLQLQYSFWEGHSRAQQCERALGKPDREEMWGPIVPHGFLHTLAVTGNLPGFPLTPSSWQGSMG